jgi:hypothetical protein
MSFGAGFVTGFANTLATGILERQKEARDYFNSQVEFARTKGLENRNKTRQVVDANLSVAKQLEAAGVPKELIMAQINQDPYGLDSFFKQAETIRAESGKSLTPDEWKAIFKVAGDFKAPNEDLATFISRTYDPISNAVKDENFESDPEGSLISSLLGFGQMDKARAGLKKTQIADGMTADQLIRYGDVQPQRVGGNATVVTDYTQIPEKPKKTKSDEFSISERNAVMTKVEEDVLLRADGMVKELGVEGARNALADEYERLYGGLVPKEDLVLFIDRVLNRQGFKAPAEPVDTEAAPAPETPQSPSVTPPTASSDPIRPDTDPDLLTLTLSGGDVLIWVKDNGDGTSDYQDAKTGVTKAYSNSVIRESF